MREHDAVVQQLDAFFRRLFASAESEALTALAEADLTFNQVRAAMLLACIDEAVPINELASQMGLSMTTVGRTLESMVELDLVERRESPRDRRVRLVSLTPEGRAVIERHFQARRDAILAFLQRLPDQHVRALAAALDPIVAGDYVRPHGDPAAATGP